MEKILCGYPSYLEPEILFSELVKKFFLYFQTHYHVVFFDERVSRTWVKADYCRLFTGSEEDDNIKQFQVNR